MLGDKCRVHAHGRLLSVISRLSGRQSLRDEVDSMLQHESHAALIQISAFLRPKPEPGAEGGSLQPRKHGVQRPHQLSLPSAVSSAASSRSIRAARLAILGSSRRVKYCSRRTSRSGSRNDRTVRSSARRSMASARLLAARKCSSRRLRAAKLQPSEPSSLGESQQRQRDLHDIGERQGHAHRSSGPLAPALERPACHCIVDGSCSPSSKLCAAKISSIGTECGARGGLRSAVLPLTAERSDAQDARIARLTSGSRVGCPAMSNG